VEFEGRTLRRTTFDAVADDYDRVRPGYLEQVLDDLVELAALSPGARLVEVGCGTGQATVPLPPPDRVADRDRIKVVVDASGWFAPAEVRHYVWPVAFTARDYVAFLGTATNFRVLDDSKRSRLSERIEHRITAEHGGTVRKEFLGTLAVARRA
jgi:SAM-dependent methyltransferase